MTNKIVLDKKDYNKLLFGVDTENYEVFEEGSWECEGKYETKTVVFRDKQGIYFMLEGCRCGSYFRDYEYIDDYEAVEVEPIEVTRVEWRAVEHEE